MITKLSTQSISEKIKAAQIYITEMDRLSDQYDQGKLPGGTFLQDIQDYNEWLTEALNHKI